MMKKLWQNRLALIMTIAMGFVSILPIVALAQANTYDMDEMNDGLEEEGVLRVGMEANYAPFNWSQTTNSDRAVEISNSSGEYANGYDV